jgi:predicted ATPase/class 3 adenylate cyclase
VSGQRRVLTVLFCDMVNSTAIAEQLDPEDWTEIVHGAFEQLNPCILRYEGTVVKLLGDAVLAFFGTPVAHEDDPQRAVLAALDMLNAMRAYQVQVKAQYAIDLNVRIGVNTGPVVVATIGSPEAMENTALGDAVNVAARMEQTAAPGTIQISGDTYRRVAPLIEVESLGDVEVKGKSKPIAAYRVLKVKDMPGPLRGVEGVSAPLIGRQRELDLLKNAVARLAEGRGQIICLIGEAGLGKSRLVSELRDSWKEIDPNFDHWHEMTGVPYDSSRPFGLYQNYARKFMGVELNDPREVIHEKVVATIRAHGGNDDVVALCSLAFERVIAAKALHDAPKQIPAEAIKQDIYDQMYPGFRASCQTASILVGEDMHWADAASVDLLIHLLSLVDEVPVLFLLAFRPERQSPAWKLKQRAETDFPHRYTEIALRPLEAEQTDELISALLHIANLPDRVRAAITNKADGNPYFVEEIVRTLIEQGFVLRADGGLHWTADKVFDDVSVPDTLQQLLVARMDRLDEEARTTLQLASVIGRSFYYRILQAISDSAIALDKRLASLERVELLEQAHKRPEVEYMFRHELARDAAYGSILNRRRREFHGRVAAAIETLFSDNLEEQAHRLGKHYALAGNQEKALKYFEMAAGVALNLHATDEVAEHHANALHAARLLGDRDAIARLEAEPLALGAETSYL